MSLGLPELIVIFAVALLVFGPKRLPELAKNLGKGIRDFKKAVSGEEEPSLPPREPDHSKVAESGTTPSDPDPTKGA